MKNQLKAGVILSYLSTGINILIRLIYVPVMIRLLGKSEYGLYSLVSSMVSYLSLFSLGFTGAYMRFFARECHDREKLAALNGMFLALFGVLSALAAVCGIGLSFFPKQIFGTRLLDTELEKARILMLILVVNIAVSLLNGILNSMLYAYEQFVVQRVISLASAVINPFLSLPLLLMGYGSVMLVIVTTGVTIARLAASMWFCFGRLKIPVAFRGFQWKLFKEIAVFSSFLLLNMVIDQINWNVDRLILGHTSGTEEVAIYDVAAQFNSVFLAFSTTISTVFVPRVNYIAARKEQDYQAEFSRLMARIGRIQWMILGLAAGGFLVFGRYFIVEIFAGKGYERAYEATLFLILPAMIPLIQNVGIEMQRALNRHQFRSLIYLAMAFINVGITIPLAGRWGAVGATMGTAFSLLVGNGLIMNLFYHYVLKIDMKRFWIEIGKTLGGFVLPTMLAGWIMWRVAIDSLAVFLRYALIFIVIYCVSVFVLSCNKEEKRMIYGLLGRR